MGEFRVLVVCDHLQWRENLLAAFAENAVFEVAGGVAAAELVEAAVRLRPDVVIWKLDEGNPVASVAELHSMCPSVLSVLLVDDPRRLDIFKLLRAGVRGCLPLRLLPRQVVQAVELIVKAGLVCLPRLGPEFFAQDHRGGEGFSLRHLTRREYEVLSLLAKSYTNQEIARALYVSESTVKTHLHSLFRKLGVRNRTEAFMAAVRLGLLEPEEIGGNQAVNP